MPKKPPRDNRKRPELRTVHTAGAGAAALLQRISREARVVLPGGDPGAGTPSWLERLRAALPDVQRPHLLEVLEKEQSLVLFVDSAVWAGRIRLSLPELGAVADGRALQVRLAARGQAGRGQ